MKQQRSELIFNSMLTIKNLIIDFPERITDLMNKGFAKIICDFTTIDMECIEAVDLINEMLLNNKGCAVYFF